MQWIISSRLADGVKLNEFSEVKAAANPRAHRMTPPSCPVRAARVFAEVPALRFANLRFIKTWFATDEENL
jgi:hypothetical protein